MNTILIVEDQKILLDGLSISLGKSFEIVGKLSNANEILPFLKNHRVDLILSDIYTGENISLNYIKSIKQDFPNIKFVAMTGLPEMSFIEQAERQGADSFVYKNIGVDELINVIKNTLNGYSTYPNKQNKNSCKILESLSKKEMDILRLYCSGYNKDEIAIQLDCSESTIRQAIRSILDLTGYESFNKLAIYVVKNSYIIPQNKD